MNKLNTREELTAFRKVCEEALKCETKQILVCGGTGCVAGGSLDIFAKLKELLEEFRDTQQIRDALAKQLGNDVMG